MKLHSKCALFCAALVAVFVAHAQTVQVPKELSGRWTFAERNATNTFSLDDIATTADGKLTAKLTWWTSDPKCALRKEPVNGTVDAKGITFDAKTKCDVEFIANLNAGDKEWAGKAVTKGGNSVTLDVKAK